MKLRAIAIVIAIMSAGVIGCVSAQASIHQTTQVIREKLVVTDPNSNSGNQLDVEDKNGAPMFWVNMFGAQSGAEPVCAMDFNLQPVICLGGKFGSYGVKPEIVYYRNGKVWKIR